MTFEEWLFQEMPITSFTKIGDFDPHAKKKYGFDKTDAGILNNPNAVAKIHKKWSNSKENFDFYFIRTPKAYKHREEGKVSPEWVKANLGVDINPNEDNITVIFTNNFGDAKIPLGMWGIAHRFGHAIARENDYYKYIIKEVEKDFRNLAKSIYNYTFDKRSREYSDVKQQTQENRQFAREDENIMRALAHSVGTMRSARQKNILLFREFAYEITAQYLITGHIKFNPLPRFLITKNTYAWGRHSPQGYGARIDEELEEWNGHLQSLASKYEHYLDSAFMSLIGNIYLM